MASGERERTVTILGGREKELMKEDLMELTGLCGDAPGRGRRPYRRCGDAVIHPSFVWAKP